VGKGHRVSVSAPEAHETVIHLTLGGARNPQQHHRVYKNKNSIFSKNTNKTRKNPHKTFILIFTTKHFISKSKNSKFKVFEPKKNESLCNKNQEQLDFMFVYSENF